MKNSLLLVILSFCFFTTAFCKTIKLEVIFPADLDFGKLDVYYNDGVEDKVVKPTINNNTWIFNDSCVGRYGKMAFYYTMANDNGTTKGYNFWISDNGAKIDFSLDHQPNENPFCRYKLQNVISLNDLQEEKIPADIRQFKSKIDNYFRLNMGSFDAQPEKRVIFHLMLDSIADKGLQLIKSRSNDYFYLFYFQDAIVSVQNSLSAIELIRYFNSVFPDSLKQTTLGKQISATLMSRINSRKGSEAPDFKVKDIEGKTLSKSDFKGKYLLIEFWASWCAPCMKLAPTIKKFRSDFPVNKLEIISVTLDDNYGMFANALKKTNTNTTHVFDGKKLVKDYAVGGIPQFILMDKNGVVIYNKDEEKDYSLDKLSQLLIDVMK